MKKNTEKKQKTNNVSNDAKVNSVQENVAIEKPDWREVITYPSAVTFASGVISAIAGNDGLFEWNNYFYGNASFDDLNFRYGNNVFSVLLQIYFNGVEVPINLERKKEWLEITKQNNLVPCIFPVEVTDNAKEYRICSKTKGWNLFDHETSAQLDPIKINSDELVPMSHYELLNLAIKSVMDELSEWGYGVESCIIDPTLDNVPQLWCHDEGGRLFWVLVKYKTCISIETPNVDDIIGGDDLMREHDGYYAPIIFTSETKAPCRNCYVRQLPLDDLMIRIHDAVRILK